MSLEPRLNDLELHLKQFVPATSAINRDVLFYRAGWDAAKKQAQGGPSWLWPGTAAALAAALLLTITLPQTSPPQRAETAPLLSPASQSLSRTPVAESTIENDIARSGPVPRGRYSPTASLLVMRERALRSEFDNFRDLKTVDVHPTLTALSRSELLQEFLPETLRTDATPEPFSHWWTKFTLGESS